MGNKPEREEEGCQEDGQDDVFSIPSGESLILESPGPLDNVWYREEKEGRLAWRPTKTKGKENREGGTQKRRNCRDDVSRKMTSS